MSTPITLIVMDGVGHSGHHAGNAVANAFTPHLERLARGKKTYLKAHGPAVGMPSWSDMGNSEVGHNALGSGQIYDQGAKLVADAIQSGRLFQGPVWQELITSVQQHNGCLHFLGLLSDGNVHSHIDHLFALLNQAHQAGTKHLRVHILLDGRDVAETSALTYVAQLESLLSNLREKGCDARIASGGGRMVITMDRYQADWAMVEQGWHTHVLGEGRRFPSAKTAIETLRHEKPGVIDQYLPPFVIGDSEPCGPILDGDGVILFNFRGDRAIEISQAFEAGSDFSHFERDRVPKVFFAGLMQYDGDLKLPSRFLVDPPAISHTLTEFLVNHGISQYALSETQKFGHVTYFWNGNRSGKVSDSLETYCEVPSDRVAFEQRPWMKAAEISDTLIEAIQSQKFRFLRVNYANGDMVGHTGDYQAALTAMCCLDLQLGRVLAAVEATKGIALITADHGNAEQMLELDKNGQVILDANGEPVKKTSHTLNPVPFYLFDPAGRYHGSLAQDPELGLANIAATVAELLGFKPDPLWQPSLLRH